MGHAADWLESCRHPRAHVMRMVCLPYAGGAANIYAEWPTYFPETIGICPVQLPARGRRMLEPPLISIDAMADSLAEDLRDFWMECPFVLFGHSMGALIVFELTRRLEQAGTAPLMIFVSGSGAPHMREPRETTWDLPNDEFIAELRTIKGTNPLLLDDREAMEVLLPRVRADFRAVQEYRYQPGSTVSAPIAAFGGLADEKVTVEQLRGWQQCTSGAFRYSRIPGDHFFIHGSLATLSRQILTILKTSKVRYTDLI